MSARVLAAISIALLAAAPAAKHPGMTKEQKIRSLLNRTGAAAMSEQLMNGMIEQAQNEPDTPKGFAEKFRELAAKDDLVSRVVPVYAANLSDADLDGLLAFYDSKAGRDFARAQPIILQGSMQAGQKWAEELADKTLAALKAEEGAVSPAPSRK